MIHLEDSHGRVNEPPAQVEQVAPSQTWQPPPTSAEQTAVRAVQEEHTTDLMHRWLDYAALSTTRRKTVTELLDAARPPQHHLQCLCLKKLSDVTLKARQPGTGAALSVKFAR